MSEIRFRSSDDELYAWVEGTGPGLIFYHGASLTHVEILQGLRGLSKDFTIVAPDARGRGKSRCPHPQHHSWDQYAADVIALIDHLGLPRVVLGGGSFGAGVAVSTALRYPERFDALILAGPVWMGADVGALPMHRRLDDLRPEIGATVLRDGVEAAVDAWLKVLGQSEDESLRQVLCRSWSEHDPTSFAAFSSFPIGSTQPFARLDDLQELAMPILVIPANDPIHPREVGEAWAAALPNSELVEAGRVGKTLDESQNDDDDRARVPSFNSVVRNFLTAHTSAEPTNRRS
jgi:3-oxoadipate enol-lactonase